MKNDDISMFNWNAKTVHAEDSGNVIKSQTKKSSRCTSARISARANYGAKWSA
jgi:hypothetical protein